MVTRRWEVAIAFLLVFVFLLQAIASMWEDAPTYDELVAPSVGYAELLTGDFGLVDDHPPFYRALIALPLLALRPVVRLEHPSWRERKQGPLDRYLFAHDFFYRSNGNADQIIFVSRLPVVFLSVVLGWLVFRWARHRYGEKAGCLALFLYVFEPNILAHSRLATNDLILTFFIFATVYQFWRYYKNPSPKALALTGALLGLALISKFSALMLVPIVVLLALLSGAQDSALSPRAALRSCLSAEALLRCIRALCLVAAFAAAVVLLFYRSQWTLFLGSMYNAMGHYETGRVAFLLGSYSSGGWWYYFPVAFLLKTPIPLLFFLLAAFLFWSFRKDRSEIFLLVPVAIITAVALGSRMNIGLRHILPLYPFLIVLASSIVSVRFTRQRFFGVCFGVLAVWYLAGTLAIFPSYLAYFNEFVGPQNGYRALVDSNLDWGQDLKRLKAFLDRNKIDSVYLSYFGTADPCRYGLRFVYLPGTMYRCQEQVQPGQRPGFIAVSATNLQSVYLDYEESYEWLKPRQPLAQIGYSIFVYDIREDPAAHYNLGILYLKYGLAQEALSEFQAVAKLSPKSSMAYSGIGLAYERLSRQDEAERAYRKALELDPQDRTARSGLDRIDRKK